MFDSACFIRREWREKNIFQSLFSCEKEHWKEKVGEQTVNELSEVIINLRKI